MTEQQTQLVGGAPVPEDRSHTEINPTTGLQRDYVVLTPEERAKGFVKPLRDSYRHVGRRPKYPLRDLTPEELARDAQHGYVKFEAYPESERPLNGRYWTAADLKSGCGRITTMHRSIAETYARNPEFYSGTFCSTCRKHFHLEQFRWEPDGEPMYVPDQAAWHEAQASTPQPPAEPPAPTLPPIPPLPPAPDSDVLLQNLCKRTDATAAKVERLGEQLDRVIEVAAELIKLIDTRTR